MKSGGVARQQFQPKWSLGLAKTTEPKILSENRMYVEAKFKNQRQQLRRNLFYRDWLFFFISETIIDHRFFFFSSFNFQKKINDPNIDALSVDACYLSLDSDVFHSDRLPR